LYRSHGLLRQLQRRVLERHHLRRHLHDGSRDPAAVPTGVQRGRACERDAHDRHPKALPVGHRLPTGLAMHRLRPAGRDDRGVTLIELLVAVVILGIIIGPLTAGLISFFRNTDATNNRMAESHDEQIASAYFAQDVQSLGVRDWTTAPFSLTTSFEQNVSATGGTDPCGPNGPPGAKIRMAWNDRTDSPNLQIGIVAYVGESVGGETQLHRLRCTKAVGGSSTLTSDLVLSHYVVSVGPPVLTGTATIPQSVSW